MDMSLGYFDDVSDDGMWDTSRTLVFTRSNYVETEKPELPKRQLVDRGSRSAKYWENYQHNRSTGNVNSGKSELPKRQIAECDSRNAENWDNYLTSRRTKNVNTKEPEVMKRHIVDCGFRSAEKRDNYPNRRFKNVKTEEPELPKRQIIDHGFRSAEYWDNYRITKNVKTEKTEKIAETEETEKTEKAEKSKKTEKNKKPELPEMPKRQIVDCGFPSTENWDNYQWNGSLICQTNAFPDTQIVGCNFRSTDNWDNYQWHSSLQMSTNVIPERQIDKCDFESTEKWNNHQWNSSLICQTNAFPQPQFVHGNFGNSSFSPRKVVRNEITKKENISVNPIRPMFAGYHMLGDSIFVRFARQLLDYELDGSGIGLYRIGLCVSGQNIKSLIRGIKENRDKIGDKVLVLIGTNDLKGTFTDITKYMHLLRQLANLLRWKSPVFLTLPPIPRLDGNKNYEERYKMFNEAILNIAKTHTVQVLEMGKIFFNDTGAIRKDYFEADNLHPNKKGLLVMRSFILEKLS